MQIGQRPGRLRHPLQHQPVLRRQHPLLRPRHHEGPASQSTTQYRLARSSRHVPEHRQGDRGQSVAGLVPRFRRSAGPMRPRILGCEGIPTQPGRPPGTICRAVPLGQARADGPHQLRPELASHLRDRMVTSLVHTPAVRLCPTLIRWEFDTRCGSIILMPMWIHARLLLIGRGMPARAHGPGIPRCGGTRTLPD